MTQVFDEQGLLQPVTVVEAGPCSVLQIKTDESDGYNAVQLGLEKVPVHVAQDLSPEQVKVVVSQSPHHHAPLRLHRPSRVQ